MPILKNKCKKCFQRNIIEINNNMASYVVLLKIKCRACGVLVDFKVEPSKLTEKTFTMPFLGPKGIEEISIKITQKKGERQSVFTQRITKKLFKAREKRIKQLDLEKEYEKCR